jgi:hypothetical protein
MTGTARNAHDALTPKVAGHVFICYTREDSNDVDQLQRALQEAGITVWRDTADLWPGDDWRMKIRSAIDNNALVFLACFSSSSIARGRSYQNEELVLAIQQLLLRPPEQPWLIPVRFDDCEIPDRSIGDGRSFTSIQRADLFGDRYEHGLQRLIVAIQRILGRHADPAPADHRLQADADLAASPLMNVLEDLRRTSILVSSSCTTSPRSSWGPARPREWRRWSSGSTWSRDRWRPSSSSRSLSSPT